jgi:anaerobic magnesium-protoporphyrin IX monomethyl ester cyclase
MKVLLLTGSNPRKVKTWVCQETSVIGSLIPPTDLCYMAAYVERHGHQAAVEDLRLHRDWRRVLAQRLATQHPDVVCTNLVTTSYLEDIEVLRTVRHLAPDVRIAAFGTHADSRRDEVFADGVDVILAGDPEAALLSLLDGRTAGVLTKQKPEAAPALLASPDDLPFDGPRFVDLDRYHAAHHAGSKRFLPLMASRGCPYRCTYCLYPTLFGGQARYRSPQSMVDELEYLWRSHGVRSVNYLDATFNLNKKRVLEFCDLLTDRHLPVQYACNVRCDLLDQGLLDAMARSGCSRLYLGVEDPEFSDTTLKNLKFQRVLDAFEQIKGRGIETVAFLMLFPGGAKNEDEYVARMGRLIQRIQPDAVQINISIPFPGTTDFENQQANLDLDWSLYDPTGPRRLPYRCDLDLLEVKRRLYRRFILRNPGKVMRVVRRLPPRQIGGLARQFVSQLLLPPHH